MAIAPQSILSKLRLMPDQELASFARAHQNDPYIFPLAFQESQDRQHLRAAKQAEAAGVQQPKVVQQDLNQMAAPTMGAAQQLPENVGIGQLPAQNIQKMADGGIVAFAGGGYTFDPNTGEAVEDTYQAQPFFPSYGRGLQIDPLKDRPELKAALQKEIAARAGTTAPVRPAANTTRQTFAGVDPRRTDNPIGQNYVGDAAGNVDTGGQSKLPPAPPTGAPTGGAGSGGYEKKFLDAIGGNEVSKEERLAEVAGIDKPVLEKMQSLIDENKSKLKSEREENFYMSLIQGGLAAAAGSGPYALQNIAQGFEKGAGHYSEGLKDLRKAAQENSKMEMALSQYEASGKKDALKSYYDHQDKMLAAKTQGLASIMGHEISKEATLGAANISAGSTRDYINAIRGGSLIETTRKNIADEVEKAAKAAQAAYKPMTEEQKLQLFQQKWTAALQANPTLAQLSGGAAGGGGAGAPSGLKIVGVR